MRLKICALFCLFVINILPYIVFVHFEAMPKKSEMRLRIDPVISYYFVRFNTWAANLVIVVVAAALLTASRA